VKKIAAWEESKTEILGESGKKPIGEACKNTDVVGEKMLGEGSGREEEAHHKLESTTA